MLSYFGGLRHHRTRISKLLIYKLQRVRFLSTLSPLLRPQHHKSESTTTGTRMRAYYFDNIPGDQRLAHDYVPSRPAPQELLTKLGVSYWQIPLDGYLPKLNAVADERGYKNRDFITVSKEGLGDVSSTYLDYLANRREISITLC